jgi:hypothetical protein
MEVEYYTIRSYGRNDRYVANKEIAKSFLLITGKKTLSDEIIEGFKMLGVSFKEVVQPSD